MVSPRRGASKLGCLSSLLIGVTIVYFGTNVGEIYLRRYRFTDAMEQEARFARSRSDDAIVRRLAAAADSLGLPDAAARVKVRRSANRVVISSEYTEYVELPFFTRAIRFTPVVDRGL